MSADISSFTSVFRAQGIGEGRKVIKRNRQPISCGSCRVKKSKCDRQQPCGSCVKRGEGSSCEFGLNANLTVTKHKESSRSEAQARLQRLEDMVNGLIQSTPQMAKSSTGELQEKVQAMSVTPATPKSRTSTGYYLSSEDSQPSFVGATHWTAILESIYDVKQSLESQLTGETSDMLGPAPPSKHDLVFGPLEPTTLSDVLVALPPRATCDAIMAVFHNITFFDTGLFHRTKFRRDYEAFWQNPTSSSFMWMSAFFSMLCISTAMAKVRGAHGLPAEVLNPKLFMEKAGQCIVSSHYMRIQPYGIEALLLYAHSKYLKSIDSDPGVWAIVGLIVRLAQKQGMHRHPESLSPKISPFEAEMRRRYWFYIETFDILLSIQMGMPPIIHENECDVGPPSNLDDEDFDEDTKVLPPSKPITIHTSSQFFSFKSGSMRLLRRVIQHALATEEKPYQETLSIDEALRQHSASIPPMLKARPIRETSFSDSMSDIMHRLMLEILYHKSMCFLHRAYLSIEKDNPKYQLSRTSCTDSAMKILDLQMEFHRECQLGGRLYEDQWMLSSLTMHDFLMAAMIICVALLESTSHDPMDRIRKLAALQKSFEIWAERKDSSRDAMHATKILGSMLAKVSSQATASGLHQSTQGIAGGSDSASPEASIPSNASSATPPSTYDSGRGGGSAQGDFIPLVDESFGLMDIDPLTNFLGNPDSLDWNMVDQYLRDTNSEQLWDMPSIS